MNTHRSCPSCGAPLSPDAPPGLCPVCLLKTDLAAKPAAKAESGEPAATITIGPEAFLRVRYFGDYELLEEIAHGGMGVVWKARQSSLNRIVALKMILAGKLAGEAEVQRFRREAEAAANLQHPNIVAIHEVGEHEGQHYYSMDYVQGRDLGALVRDSGPLPPARAAECLKTLAEAVHFAHQRGTLHRDLKPQNVLLDAAGVPHITDFGLAKFTEREDSLTRPGEAMGSPSYMPPEQAAGQLDQVGPHSDVYGLGAILYELLTGRPPFRAETAMATMRQVMESEPVALRKLNADVPPDLETLCLKCLEKNPARRYPSARALAEELGRFLKHEPIQALPVSAARKAESWLRRHPWTLMAAAALVIMVLAGLLYWQYERVQFLENRPLVTEQGLQPPGLWTDQLCDGVAVLILATILWALVKFQRYGAKKQSFKQSCLEPAWLWAAGPTRPVSQRRRVVFGLISVATLGFTMLCFAKIIQASVWGATPDWGAWQTVFFDCYLSLMLLFAVVRDYQKFVYGTPSRTLPAEQSELLCQAVFDDNIAGAIKLYRRTLPDASPAEGRDFVVRLARELKAKHPEKFKGLELRDLNWRLMGLWLVAGLGVFAGLWRIMPPVAPAARLFLFGGAFLFGASSRLRASARLKGALKGFHAFGFHVFLVSLVGFVVALEALKAVHSFQENMLGLGGLVFGVCMIGSGLRPKRRKSTQSITGVNP